MAQSMNEAERRAFLAEVRVAILSLPDGERGPLCAPVWYDFDPSGDIWFLTHANSRKGRLIAEGGRLTLTAQREASPYAYVSVEGVVTAIASYDIDADLLPMAQRYLGAEGGRAYAEGMRADWSPETSIKVTLRPARWLSANYAKPAG